MSALNGVTSAIVGAANAAAAGGFKVERSLRFNKDDSANLSKTFSGAGSRKQWTWSGWIKRNNLDGIQRFYGGMQGSSGSNDNYTSFFFDGNGYFNIGLWLIYARTSNAQFRDPSAWYHLVVSADLDNADNNLKFRAYINGDELTWSSTSNNPSTTGINGSGEQRIGTDTNGTSNPSDINLAEVHFVDGQVLAPTAFAEYDANNNWNPKDCKDDLTYGTNGFYLNFSDNSSTSALGTDSSGNGNNWTVNNLSLGGVPYSSYGSGTVASTRTYDKAFDGSTSTFCEPADNQTITFDFTSLSGGGISVSSSLRMYLNKAGTPAAGHFTVNGTNLGGSIPSGGWLTINGVSLLETITFYHASGSSSVELYAVEVDSTILVDGSVFDNDSLIDTPTNYQADSGNNGGNYCTLNPLDQNGGTLSNGNLDYDLGNGTKFVSGTIAVNSGLWYWEAKAVSGVTNGTVGGRFGISQTPTEKHGENGPFTLTWHATAGIQTFINGSGTTRLSGTGYSDGDVLSLALDADNNISYWYKNGSLIYTYDFSSLVAAGTQFLAPSTWNGSSGTPVWTFNFGQQSFIYTPRTNHKSLCTQNLPNPTIADGSTAFDVALWTGNGSSQTVSSLNFNPDIIWTKTRSNAVDSKLVDTVRGLSEVQETNQARADYTDTNGVTSTSATGFSLGSAGDFNTNGRTYVGWTWDAGTSTVSNSDGSLTSNVRANQSAGCSIVTFTTNSSSGNATVGHGLSAAPAVILMKADTTYNWDVYHSAISNSKDGRLMLNSGDAFSTTYAPFGGVDPTSSVFTMSQAFYGTGLTTVAYCFASVEGFSKVGSYTGNASTDGPFVYTGFRPTWVMAKSQTYAGNWNIFDYRRPEYNETDGILRSNTSGAEFDGSAQGSFSIGVDLLSNGFKLRQAGVDANQSGQTLVYLAFAEHPFKTSRAR